MQPPRRLRLLAFLVAAPLFAAPLAGAPAAAQDSLTPDAAQTQLSAVLSLISFGLIGPPDHPPQITRDGDAYRIRVPLPVLATPPDAALDALAQPVGGGVWDITSLTFPAAGSVAMMPQAGNTGPANLSFTIGRQANHGRIDPSLAEPSPFTLELDDLTIRTEGTGQQSDQTIGRQTMQGTFTGDADHRLTLLTQGTATDWKISARDAAGTVRNSLIRSVATSLQLEGLDRPQAERLRAAARALATSLPPGGRLGGTPADLTPFQRDQLRAMLDASTGLLTRISLDETLEGIHFEAPGGNNSGDIGRVRFGLTGESVQDHLNASLDVALHDLKLAAVPADTAAFMPSVVHVRPAVSGIRTDALMRLLRHATAPDLKPGALQAEATALLNEPGARVGIESLSLVSGPLRLEASARLHPAVGGTPGFDAHVVAHGVDAMIAATQHNPKAQQIMPIIFLAKGMARPDGDGLVWDIVFNDGVFTVNGVALGQPAGAPPRPKRP